MKNISEIFAAAVKSIIQDVERGTKSRLAREAGISFSQFSDMLTGRRQGSEEQRRAIAKALNWNYEELLRLGECLNQGQPYQNLETEIHKYFFKVPILNFGNKSAHDTIMIHGPTIGRQIANQIIAITVPDDSMEPLITKGGLLVIDSALSNISEINDKSIYLVSDIKSELWQVRQLEKVREDLIALKPLNDRYQTIYQKPSELRLIGKVIWASRIIN